MADVAMIFTLILTLNLLVFLFMARGVFAVMLCRAKWRAGDYDGALRRLRWIGLGIPNLRLLHTEGLILSMAGRSAEAARRYRTALGIAQSGSQPYPRERLHACLGYALIDVGKYAEAEECFRRAIQVGDQTGSSHSGLAELRLMQGVEAEKALDYVGQAIEHAKRRKDGRVHWGYYAAQAWALALLGRREEARQSIAPVLAATEPSAPGSAELHWRTGKVLLAMNQPEEALKHFRMGHDADPHGKYGHRCAQPLDKAA